MPRPRNGASAECCSVGPLAGVLGAVLVRRSFFLGDTEVTLDAMLFSHRRTRMNRLIFAVALLMLFLPACSSDDPPTQQLSNGHSEKSSNVREPANAEAFQPKQRTIKTSTRNATEAKQTEAVEYVWREIENFSGTGIKNTQTFTVNSSQWAIAWNVQPQGEVAEVFAVVVRITGRRCRRQPSFTQRNLSTSLRQLRWGISVARLAFDWRQARRKYWFVTSVGGKLGQGLIETGIQIDRCYGSSQVVCAR